MTYSSDLKNVEKLRQAIILSKLAVIGFSNELKIMTKKQ